MAVDFEYYELVGRIGLNVKTSTEPGADEVTLRPEPGARVVFKPSQKEVQLTQGAESELRAVREYIGYVDAEGYVCRDVSTSPGTLGYGINRGLTLPRLKGERVNPAVPDEKGDWSTAYEDFVYTADEDTDYPTTFKDPHTGGGLLLEFGVVNDLAKVSTVPVQGGQAFIIGPRGATLADFEQTAIDKVRPVLDDGTILPEITLPPGAPGGSDTSFAQFAGTAGTQTKAAIEAYTETGYSRHIYVGPNGSDTNSGLTMSNAKATLLGALTAMGKNVKGLICALPGEIPLGAGTVNWTGYKASLVGCGALATKFTVTNQTGPMLDLRGVNYDLNGGVFSGFYLQGDNTRGVEKQGLALDPDTSIINASFHDIEVRKTGGTGFALGYTEFATFTKLYAWQPVGAVLDDVPYISGYGAFNGNTFRDCILHAEASNWEHYAPTGQSCGLSGAVIIRDNGATSPHDNLLDGFKVEHLQLPTNGTIFNLAGNGTVLTGLQVFDCGKVAGSTGTSYVLLDAPLTTNLGGNFVLGVIPGKGTNATDIDCGVRVRQSRNRILGTKGFRGTNVILESGAGYTHVHIAGGVAAASDDGYVDNSGQTTNHLIDEYKFIEKRPAFTITQGAVSVVEDQPGGAWAGGRRWYDPATPANGAIGMGTSGARWNAIGVNSFLTSDSFIFRSIALANIMGLVSSGVRGVRFYDTGTLPAASATYRGVTAFVQGTTGVADRQVECRAAVDGSYAWVDLLPAPAAATTAQLTSATDPVNTVGKLVGRSVFNSTTSRPVWAVGAGATANWVDATGAVAHTPA